MIEEVKVAERLRRGGGGGGRGNVFSVCERVCICICPCVCVCVCVCVCEVFFSRELRGCAGANVQVRSDVTAMKANQSHAGSEVIDILTEACSL